MITKRVKAKLDQVFVFMLKVERKKFNKQFKDIKLTYQDSEICLDHKDYKVINEADKQIKEWLSELTLYFVQGGRKIEDLPQYSQLQGEIEMLDSMSKEEVEAQLSDFEKAKTLDRMVSYIKEKIKKGNCEELVILDADKKEILQKAIEDHFGAYKKRSQKAEDIPKEEEKKKYKSKDDPVSQEKPLTKSQSLPAKPNEDEAVPKLSHRPNSQSKLVAKEEVNSAYFEQQDFSTYIQLHDINWRNIKIHEHGGVTHIEFYEQRQFSHRVLVFREYFQYRSYYFAAKDREEEMNEVWKTIRDKYPILEISKTNGYCPFSGSELQSQLNNGQMGELIASKNIGQSKHNLYPFCGIRFSGLRNESREACQEFRRLLEAVPDVQKPEKQLWKIPIPSILSKSRNDKLEELLLRVFAQCFNSSSHGNAQLMDSDIVKQQIVCTVVVHEPKKSAESVKLIKNMLGDLIGNKLLKFECPKGLSIDELEKASGEQANDIFFHPNEQGVWAICTDTACFTRLIKKLDSMNTIKKLDAPSHMAEVLNESIKNYQIAGTNIAAEVTADHYTVVVSGYDFKVELVVQNLKKLIESLSKQTLQTTHIIGHEEHQLLQLNGTYNRVATEFSVKVSQNDVRVQEIRLVLPTRQTLLVSDADISNNDIREYVCVIFDSNDWATIFPDQALDAIHLPKLFPNKKAIYVPNLQSFTKDILQEYRAKLEGAELSRICTHLPKGRSQKGFQQLLEMLKSRSDIAALAIHARKNQDIAQIKLKFEKYTGSQEVASLYCTDKNPVDLRKRKWYCLVENNARSAYSDMANNKFNQALLNNQHVLELDENDVAPPEDTHSYNRNTHQLTHIKSGSVIQLKKTPASQAGLFDRLFSQSKVDSQPKLLYEYDLGTNRKLPQSEVAKITSQSHLPEVPIRLALYTVDLNKLIQTNLFSGFRRKMEFQDQQTVVIDTSKIDCKPYQSLRVLVKLEATARHILIKAKQSFIKSVEELQAVEVSLEFQEKFMDRAEVLNYCFDKSLKVLELRSSKGMMLIKVKTHKRSDLDALQISYKERKISTKDTKLPLPSKWVPHPDEYSLHDVPSTSEEFKQVSREFKIFPIQSLKRVQNRYIWKMYAQEKQHLQEISKKPNMKEMMLFHGTRNNPPNVIYEDKEEAFNINYSSDANMFGRGIYFAKEAAYSHSYSHPSPNLARRTILMCRVLVGTSQERVHTEACRHLKDTSCRDLANGIKYESIKSNYGGSDIYIIYKSRRAYPEYVIEY